MDYFNLKGRIDKAIQSHPFDYEPLNDLLDLCREYEKIDFEVAHARNHRMRPAIAYALKATVKRNDFLAAERLNDLLFRSLIFSAPHYFDDYLQAVEFGRPHDKKFYQLRRHNLKRYVDAYQEVLEGKPDFLPHLHVEALLLKYVQPVRYGRHDSRKAKPRSFVSFTYRVA